MSTFLLLLLLLLSSSKFHVFLLTRSRRKKKKLKKIKKFCRNCGTWKAEIGKRKKSKSTKKWFVRKCFVSFDTLKLQISLAFFPPPPHSPPSSSAPLIFTTINISLNKFLMFLRVIIAPLTEVLSLPLPLFPPSHPHFSLVSFCFPFLFPFQFASFHCCHLTAENYYCKVSENNEAMMTVSLCFLFHYTSWQLIRCVTVTQIILGLHRKRWKWEKYLLSSFLNYSKDLWAWQSFFEEEKAQNEHKLKTSLPHSSHFWHKEQRDTFNFQETFFCSNERKLCSVELWKVKKKKNSYKSLLTISPKGGKMPGNLLIQQGFFLLLLLLPWRIHFQQKKKFCSRWNLQKFVFGWEKRKILFHSISSR